MRENLFFARPIQCMVKTREYYKARKYIRRFAGFFLLLLSHMLAVSHMLPVAMDWNCCVICGCEGALKCPADSFQGNGLEVYRNFLQVVKEFQELQNLPATVKFDENETAESFMVNKAKWHKACHLKFAPSKLLRAREKTKRQLEADFPALPEEGRRSKRLRVGKPCVESCIFCSEVGGKLHKCSTMSLDWDLRRIATSLEDADLLARISGGDLVAIEAKYHHECLTKYKNKYRSQQRAVGQECPL